MGNEVELYVEPIIEPIMSLLDERVLSFLGKNILKIKIVRRGVKAYHRYGSHGLKDPIFITNAASSIFAGASLLSLGGAKVLKFTNLSSASEPLFLISATLSSMSDELGECCEWHSPIF